MAHVLSLKGKLHRLLIIKLLTPGACQESRSLQ